LCFADAGDSSYLKYEVISGTTFEITTGETTLRSTGSVDPSACTLSDGKIFISFSNSGSPYKGYYCVLNTNYSVATGDTLLYDETTFASSALYLPSGYIFYSILRSTATQMSYTVLKESDYSVVAGPTNYYASANNITSKGTYNSDENEIFIAFSDSTNTYKGYYFTFTGLTYNDLLVSTDSVVNGITFTATDTDYLKRYFNCASAELDVEWCEISDIESTVENINCIVISSDSNVDIKNSKIYDCDVGTDTTADTSTFTDSQFYRISKGYAIDVDGAATSTGDITVEHCDIFDCYGGIRLQNNDGDNEVVKNNILHDINVYAIYADTTITLDNSIYTDSLSGVTIGSSVSKINPLYVNEGFNNPADIDLNLKTKILGYPADSPAKDLADDDRNAGAINVVYLGSETAWTSITVPKPQIIPIEGVYSGAVNTQRRDGSYSSYKDGESEVIKMRWSALSTADFALIKTMWRSSSSTVRIYPDPVTSPYNYEVYTLLRNSLNMGVVFVTLGDYGVQTIELTFAKAM
jgi:hypothetical protein